MTKELTAKAEELRHILEEHCNDYERDSRGCYYDYNRVINSLKAYFKKKIRPECKRFALECVPKEHNLCSSVEEYNDSLIWNSCREQMIKNIEYKK